MLSVARLQQECQRVQAVGKGTNRHFDIEAVMAEMRDQGLDPYKHEIELIFGPTPTLTADDQRLERFVFRVTASKPSIEIEVELFPGQLAEAEWQPLKATGWLHHRISSSIPDFYPAGE
jgi:hypothetical protein